MKLLRDLSPQLALAGIVALQISCGDSSGPGPTAASIAANSSTTLLAAPGTQVAEVPSVIVRDANGNPLAGVTVTFAVTSGGGTITGGHAVSNSAGEAHVSSWTLGSTPGTNTLTAATGSLPPVTFTAQGADPCATALPHTFGTTTNGTLTVSDCDLGDGSFIDLYSVTIPSAGTYVFTQAGNFDTYLFLIGSESRIGENDDGPQLNTSLLKAILPAGSFFLGANALQPGVTGTYTLTSAATTAQVTNCENVFLIAGISSQQSIQSTDCSTNGVLADDYLIFLIAGRSITASMSSSALDSYLEIFAVGNSTALASNDNIDGTTQDARLAFTAQQTGYYFIAAGTKAAGVTGAYTLTVQ
jgi:Bacterial Ig-like domain (group 1)